MKCPYCGNELQLRIDVNKLGLLHLDTKVDIEDIIFPDSLHSLPEIPAHVNCVRAFNSLKIKPNVKYYDRFIKLTDDEVTDAVHEWFIRQYDNN